MADLPPIPDEPVTLALVGAGSRSSTHYAPALRALEPWYDFVAVCDPVEEHADEFAAELGIEAYYDIHKLVDDRPMEAAIAVTPIDSHHSISVYLSRNGVNNMVETTMARSLTQAREMVETARENDVTFRVAENFFRKPIDRIVQTIMAEDAIEGIRRIFCYNDHTGYHNNSRWIRFFDRAEWVQSVEHTIPTAPFDESRQRHHEEETFRGRYFGFPDGELVVDQASNIKAFLGRHPRPGYTEWQGRQGTIVQRAVTDRPHDGRSAYSSAAETEIRYTSDEALKLSVNAGRPDVYTDIENEFTEDDWVRTTAELPDGSTLSYENPLRLSELCADQAHRDELEVPYDIEIMGHLVDFALAVRGIREGEFTDEDALSAMEMEVGAKESARRDGERVDLPVEGDLPVDEDIHAAQREKHGVDPLDVDEMLALTYPKP
ncbi:MAG: Gfo/Idh/MocA family protein [Halobacteriaceae archaeon]